MRIMMGFYPIRGRSIVQGRCPTAVQLRLYSINFRQAASNGLRSGQGPLSASMKARRSAFSSSPSSSGSISVSPIPLSLRLAVEIDYVTQRGESAVVHERLAALPVAQRRGLEHAHIRFVFRDGVPSLVVFRSGPDVVEIPVGEVAPDVAEGALTGGEEGHATAVLRLAQRRSVALQPAVVGRLTGDQAPLEIGDHAGNVVDADALDAQRRERFAVMRFGAHSRHGFVELQVQLDRIGDRPLRLFLERFPLARPRRRTRPPRDSPL